MINVGGERVSKSIKTAYVVSVVLILFPFLMAGLALATSLNTDQGLAHYLIIFAPMGMWLGLILGAITLIVHKSRSRKAEQE